MSNFYVAATLVIFSACNAFSNEQVSANFVREANPMVLTQIVKLSVDGKMVGKISHGGNKELKLKAGKHKFETKVGLSLGVPNVTGFNGAKKFSAVYDLRDSEHFFKIVFKPALMGGKHEIIEVDKKEFLKMGKRKKKEPVD